MELKTKNTRGFWAFAAVLALFVILRLGAALTSVERVSYPDELGAGTIAYEVLRGLKMPLHAYQVDFYSGESLVSAAFTLPFFKILGPSQFSLKMALLLQAFLLCCFMAAFVFRWFGGPAAILLLFLLALCPPFLSQAFFIPVTAHLESFWGALAVLWAFSEFLKEGGNRNSACMFFGFISGLSFWLYPQTVVMPLACCAVWLVRGDFSRQKKFYLCFIFFAALGMAPWWMDNFSHGSRHFLFMRDSFGLQGVPAVGAVLKFFKLLFLGIPLSFSTFPAAGVPAPLYSAVWALVFYAALTAFYLRGLGREPLQNRHVRLALAAYFPCFLAVMTLSRFDVMKFSHFFMFRYLTHFMLVLMIAVAAALPVIKNKKTLLAVLLVLGLLGQTSFMLREAPGTALRSLGYSHHVLGMRLAQFVFPAEKYFRQYGEIAGWFGQRDRVYVYHGLLAESERPPLSGTEIMEDGARLPENFRPVFFEKSGELYVLAGSKAEDMEKAAATLPEEARRYFRRGIARAGGGGEPSGREKGERLLCDDCLWQPEFARRLENFPAGFGLVEAELNDAAYGLGWAIRAALLQDRERAGAWIARLPGKYSAAAADGAEAFEAWYRL